MELQGQQTQNKPGSGARVVASEVQAMFGSIARRYDLANSVLSLGIHHSWRRKLVRLLPERRGGLVLDLCSGTGDLIPLLEARFGTVIGGDFCYPMLHSGRAKFAAAGKTIPRFIQSDALQLPFPDRSFDIVSVAFGVRNFENTRAGLKEILRVLKPDGRLLVLEFGQPRSPVFGALYRFYSRFVMPLIGGVLTGNRQAYTYLPQTAAAFPCGVEFARLLEEVGFVAPVYRPLTLGIAFAYSAARPV